MDQTATAYNTFDHDCTPAADVAIEDPAFSAIASHREAAVTFLREHAAYVAAGPDSDHVHATDAMSAWCRAAEALAGTMPSSMAGVEALRRHLLDGETGSTLVLTCIRMPLPGSRWWTTYSGLAVEWLCDRHQERITGRPIPDVAVAYWMELVG
jgi:hypothetical protein